MPARSKARCAIGKTALHLTREASRRQACHCTQQLSMRALGPVLGI
ncbi:protein of unassigned function [Methylobacterium oryzae CBMB20]|uniref:Protein of unassigned function n=1 Tax=Methylobacterium oryzae CBMB20 TaxID=693986 RepID=A0A089NY41_9HYPH|nr:protein of unassigned function [Methylobacterium oryzae CBMB20]